MSSSQPVCVSARPGPILLSLALFALLAGACSDRSSPTAAPLDCATSSLHGAYGVQRNGLTAPNVHVAAVGVAIFDGNGGLHVQETTSQNGTFVTSARSDSYMIGSNCMGTESDANGTAIASLAVVHDGDEVLGLSLAAGSNSTTHYERVVGTCSNATLNGPYGFQRNGLNAAGAQLVALGTITFDGIGSQVVRQTIDRGGSFTTVDQVGKYQVSSDCTGQQSDTTGVFSNIVVVNGGGEVLGISMTTGNIVVVHYEKNAK